MSREARMRESARRPCRARRGTGASVRVSRPPTKRLRPARTGAERTGATGACKEDQPLVFPEGIAVRRENLRHSGPMMMNYERASRSGLRYMEAGLSVQRDDQ